MSYVKLVDYAAKDNLLTGDVLKKVKGTELDTEFTAIATASAVSDAAIATHIANPTGAHAATAISNTPAGTIAATTVQAAINELDTEKAAVAGTLAQFAATTSAQLAGVISDETGSGSLVFATSPTLVTPALGTPTSGTLDNCTTNTEAAGNNTTQLSSTAFVQQARASAAAFNILGF